MSPSGFSCRKTAMSCWAKDRQANHMQVTGNFRAARSKPVKPLKTHSNANSWKNWALPFCRLPHGAVSNTSIRMPTSACIFSSVATGMVYRKVAKDRLFAGKATSMSNRCCLQRFPCSTGWMNTVTRTDRNLRSFTKSAPRRSMVQSPSLSDRKQHDPRTRRYSDPAWQTG